MTKSIKDWHDNFLDYMEFIIHHPTYEGLPIKRKKDGSWSWVATKQTQIGQERIKWCENKAQNLGYAIQPGVYARVMREIHPTKVKVCQTCGEEMSIYYYYPSINLLRSLKKEFRLEFNQTDHISDVWDVLLLEGISKNKISKFFMDKIGLDVKDERFNKTQLIDYMEYQCRVEGKRLLSPGAMSNFPDRFDGFHTYNLCCRDIQDKGRSKENLKSYTRDRRAYEYWSDGNIHAANQFMGSDLFNGISADHIGPISLGFVHDPRYIKPMNSSENSSKRDRLQIDDIELLIEIEKNTNRPAMSRHSWLIWEYIKNNYKRNPDKVEGIYRNVLKQNLSNYMYIVWKILEMCSELGEEFIEKMLLADKFETFNFNYTFDKAGNIIDEKPRNFTERSKNELRRYKRIAISSVYEYIEKDNRHINPFLTVEEHSLLNELCIEILDKAPLDSTYAKFNKLILIVQQRLIENLN